MTARYFKVSPKIWNEPWDDDSRLLAFYILTSPHRSTEGLFRLPMGYIREDMGWPDKRIRPALATLIDAGFIDYDEEKGVLLIVKALKYQTPRNPNAVTSATSVLETIPPTKLDIKFGELAQQHSELLAQGLAEQFGERFGHPLALAPSLSQTQEDVGPSFDDFWIQYPARKGATKGSKKNALVEWKKLSVESREAAIGALPAYTRASNGYTKDAERYLKHAAWEGLDVAASASEYPEL